MRVPDADRTLILEARTAAPKVREERFRELYERHKGRVYNLCYRITRNGADALDASQAAFSAAFLRLGAFRFDSQFSSWLYRIAVNACLDLKRRTAAQGGLAAADPSSGGDGLDEVEDPAAASPFEATTRAEADEQVRRAVSRLSPRLRTIVALRYFENLSYERIAEVLGISLGTVKSRLFRAHAALGRRLGSSDLAGGAR